jgi:hypothetical protein
MLIEELRAARLVEADSILEWRVAPERLTEELALFLDEVWAPPRGLKAVGSAINGDGREASARLGS